MRLAGRSSAVGPFWFPFSGPWAILAGVGNSRLCPAGQAVGPAPRVCFCPGHAVNDAQAHQN